MLTPGHDKDPKMQIKKISWGLSWFKNPPVSIGDTRFDPWSVKIPYMPWSSSACKPQLLSPRAFTLLQKEATAMRSHCTVIQAHMYSNEDPGQSKKKKTPKTQSLRAGVRQVLWYKPGPCTRYLEIQEPLDKEYGARINSRLKILNDFLHVQIQSTEPNLYRDCYLHVINKHTVNADQVSSRVTNTQRLNKKQTGVNSMKEILKR